MFENLGLKNKAKETLVFSYAQKKLNATCRDLKLAVDASIKLSQTLIG